MDWCWSWSSSTLATWCEELTHWERAWCWERLKTGGEGMTEGEMVWWHHWLNRHDFEQTSGVGDGQRSPACFSSWGRKELDTTERLNWIEPRAGTSQVVLLVKDLSASAENIRNASLIPVSGRSPGGGHSNPLQCSCLEKPMDRGAWWA